MTLLLPVRRGSWVAIPLALALASCGVVESHRVDLAVPPLAYDSPCKSSLGSYSLPKAFLHIRIGQKKDQPPDIALSPNDTLPAHVVRHPDPHLFFCLDYLNSPTSDDKVQVLKWPSDPSQPKEPFLGAVMINATDQSAYILSALIRAAFIGLSGDSGFMPARAANFDQTEIIADYEFDPFNPREAATINSQLVKHGFCLVLENYMFDPAVGVQRYCGAPLRHTVERTVFFKAYRNLEETPADPQISGLVYRPRHPYRLFIYHKLDVAGPDPWQLQYTTTLQMENLSPLLSLGVTRAMFANKTISFMFIEGALQNACVSKTSELAGFVEIPLQISRSLVALPGEIAKVQINDVNSESQLVAAQNSLYKIQQSYLQALLGGKPNVTSATQTATATQPSFASLGVPGDLTPLPSTVDWGSDLFNNKLSGVCGNQT
jgi:hypothetical protein